VFFWHRADKQNYLTCKREGGFAKLLCLLLQGVIHLCIIEIHDLITYLVAGQLFDVIVFPPVFLQIKGCFEKL
jgi:hypothetical protein